MAQHRQKVGTQIQAKQIISNVKTHIYGKNIKDQQVNIKEKKGLNQREEVKEIFFTNYANFQKKKILSKDPEL